MVKFFGSHVPDTKGLSGRVQIMTPAAGERFFDFPVIHYNSCQKQKKRFLRDVGTHIAIDKVIPFFFLHHFLPPITARFTRAVLVSETGLDSEDAKP